MTNFNTIKTILPEFVLFWKKPGKNPGDPDIITGINAYAAAKALLQTNDFLYASAPNSDHGTYYRYEEDTGVYKAVSEKYINKLVKTLLEQYGQDKVITVRNINEIVNLMNMDIQNINYTDFDSDEDIINFRNGILRLSTLKLEPHSPKYFSTIQIPVDWNPNAAYTPVFDKYLDYLTALHYDQDDVKRMLMEFIGVCISNIPGYKYKTSLLMFGKGNTGKTQLRELVIDLIGREKSAAIEMNELEAERGPGRCFGKRLFGSGDMSFLNNSQVKVFKNITGGDDVNIRFLYKEPFSAKLTGVFWNVSNALPLFSGDKGDHVYQRFIPVRCDNVIPASERDPDILQKMLAEAEGIVYKAVMAMYGTVNGDNYKYTMPQSCIDELKVYKVANNVCLEFFEEYCADNRDKLFEVQYTEAQIRKTFTNWAKANYQHVPSKADFEKSIAEHLEITVDKLHVRTAEKRTYCFIMDTEAFQEWY